MRGHPAIAFVAALALMFAAGYIVHRVAWQHGYWSGVRIAQWNCHYNPKTCAWAAEFPPGTPGAAEWAR